MSFVRQVWVAFNSWRRRHWPFRVIILCLFLANTLVGASFYPRLERDACDRILADAETKLLDATYRANRASATRHLQVGLVSKFDADGDGVLNDAEAEAAQAVGLDPAQLWLAPLQTDLEHLVAAAQHAEFAPRSLAGRVIRREAWRDAVIEAEEIMEPERQSVEAMVAWWQLPDYGVVSTWRKGLSAFYEWIVLWGLYGFLGNPFHWVPFFVMTYLAAVIAVVLLRGRRALAALLTATIISAAVNVLWAAVLPHSIRDYWLGPSPPNWLRIVCDSCLILAAAVAGVRRGARYTNRKGAFHAAVILLGLLLVAWGALPTPHPGLRLEPGYQFPFLLNGEVFPIMKACMCVIGLAVLAAHLSIVVRNRRRWREQRTATA